ncbi:MAG: hypothetical protein D6692_00995 [Planctomycetota bacterium]|nr:MAG: hypothetical protein D6692_00995 [Planctomycetota bacterium]
MLTNRTIGQVRGVALWVIRSAGVCLLGYGVFLVGSRLMFGVVGPGDVVSAWRVWDGIGAEHGVYRGGPMMAIGLALALASRPLARWIVCVPDAGCPGCGYAGGSVPGTPCPECGRIDPGDSAAAGG